MPWAEFCTSISDHVWSSVPYESGELLLEVVVRVLEGLVGARWRERYNIEAVLSPDSAHIDLLETIGRVVEQHPLNDDNEEHYKIVLTPCSNSTH